MRPCECTKSPSYPYQPGECLRCFQWMHNPEYRSYHSGKKWESREGKACVYLGRRARVDGAVKKTLCKPCGNKEVEVFECKSAEYGPETTLAKCQVCHGYQTRKVNHRAFEGTQIIDLKNSFNCSLLEVDGRLKLFPRVGWVQSRIASCDLSAPEDLSYLDPNLDSFVSFEDPRAFTVAGKPLVGFSAVKKLFNRLSVKIGLAELSRDCQSVAKAIVPSYELERPWEKNWGWFDYNGVPHAVYTVSPHTILRLDGDKMHQVARSHWVPSFGGGVMRGGAPPIKVGDEYWNFFHGVIETQLAVPKKIYNIGLYTFDAKPPFEPRRFMMEPILWPEESSRPHHMQSSVIFPCGAVFKEGKWLISHGVHDQACAISAFDHSKLEEDLTCFSSTATSC